MTQNIYDDPDFFAGYSGLPRSTGGLDDAPEWHALRALLPDPAGRRIVDLGCGFGWFCRWAADEGAAAVLGLDVSEKMLSHAAATNAHPAISYRRADLETLAMPEQACDLAYSSLTLHYVADLHRLLATVHRALVPGGRFVFSMEHPIFMASARPGWIVNPEGGRTWPVDGYQVEGPRVTDWFAPGVIKQHRTLGTIVNLLIRTGFTLAHLEEWGPTDAQIAANPALAEERDRPMFLLAAADR